MLGRGRGRASLPLPLPTYVVLVVHFALGTVMKVRFGWAGEASEALRPRPNQTYFHLQVEQNNVFLERKWWGKKSSARFFPHHFLS